MSFRQIIARSAASLIYFIKKSELTEAESQFLIFTGTVGKTTMKDTVYHALKELNLPAVKSKLGYNNELGILLTVLGIDKFSLKNPTDWIKLIKAKIKGSQFVCIELGADFYHDVDWFLKKFKPTAVFINELSTREWAGTLPQVFLDKQKLFESISSTGYLIYNEESKAVSEVVKNSRLSARAIPMSLSRIVWTKNYANIPAQDLLNILEKVTFNNLSISFNRPLFLPQLYGIVAALTFIYNINQNQSIRDSIFTNYDFSDKRLQFHKAKNGSLILEDIYKATPVCTQWFLKMSQEIKAKKKILILSELRPLTRFADTYYTEITKSLGVFEKIYFIGHKNYYNLLQTPRVEHITMDDYTRVAKDILLASNAGDTIFLKGSAWYHLEKLRDLLLS